MAGACRAALAELPQPQLQLAELPLCFDPSRTLCPTLLCRKSSFLLGALQIGLQSSKSAQLEHRCGQKSRERS